MGVVDLDDVVVFLRVVLILDVSDDFLNEILNGNMAMVLESDFMECRRSLVF